MGSGAQYGSRTVTLTGTSPTSATTTAGTQQIDIGRSAQRIQLLASTLGATGGSLDLFVQTTDTPNTEASWVDFAHFDTISAAAAAAKQLLSTTKQSQEQPPLVIGASTTPLLDPGIVPGGWKRYLRLCFKANASTSAGAAQSVEVKLS